MKHTHEYWKEIKYPEPKQWHLSKNWLYQSAKIMNKWEDGEEMSEEEFSLALEKASEHHG